VTDVPPPHQPAPQADDIAASMTARVQSIMAEAERSARQVQEEVEARTARQAAETRIAAETDAARIRSAAESQAAQYLADARARVEEYAVARQRRIDELTNDLLERGALLQRRLDEAIDVRARLDETLAALTQASADARAEATRPADPLPDLPSPSAGRAGEPLPERLQGHAAAPPRGTDAPPEGSA
jgi:hypothetical protein